MRSWPRHILIGLVVLAVLLLAARIALPLVVKNTINKRLSQVPDYVGHVDDVGIHLWRGAYSLHGVSIAKRNGEIRVPFVQVKDLDFSVAWRELFRGKIVSEVDMDEAQVNFVKGPTEASSQTEVDKRWQDVVESIFPIYVQHLEIKRGLVRYEDTTQVPAVDVFIKNMHLVATGLRNRGSGDGEAMPAEIRVEGQTLGEGKLKIELRAEPLAAQPMFHVSVNLDDVNLPSLNDSLKAYANVDVGQGTFRLASEMAARDGAFEGYVKPFFENLNFNNLEDKDKGVGTRLWEKVVAGLAWLVKNKNRDQVATRIPFSGKFGDPQFGLLATIGNLFRHGFIQAFNPTIEGSVKPATVQSSGTDPDKSAQKKAP